MSKFFQAFLTGIFFTFILDFFIFLGIKLNYIDKYEIDLYYNILFADNQCFILYAIFSALIGYVVIYINNNKISLIFLGSLFSIVILTLIPPIGHSLGELILMQKSVNLEDKNHTYEGDIIYNGREKITIYEYELQKIITLDKNRLKGEN
ncbi:MAG: hypothetical protein U9Q40_01955 [Campylobacterota bacterium]|nr:hypothetical protein [Campylobacterota bacterium]